jgi:hypothetical protein
MDLTQRIKLLVKLGTYLQSDNEEWKEIKIRAEQENGWFSQEFINLATTQISDNFLREDLLSNWAAQYQLPATLPNPKIVGIVMAGNIPLVGFHDWLCVFISGHISHIKPSSKDRVLITHLVKKLTEWDAAVKDVTVIAEMLKGCDAYIATGSNNSAGYFTYYFSKYPHIIRKNRTSVAILSGKETPAELELLADDVYQYFGLGCRNVTKLYVPEGYDFIALLGAFKKYERFADHYKYKNNYDYNLAIHLLNKKYYMSTPSILVIEDKSNFSPISQLNYEFFNDRKSLQESLKANEEIQCIVSNADVKFGEAQHPSLTDYPDGVDTIKFLQNLS